MRAFNNGLKPIDLSTFDCRYIMIDNASVRLTDHPFLTGITTMVHGYCNHHCLFAAAAVTSIDSDFGRN